jgi:hypothetical protein
MLRKMERQRHILHANDPVATRRRSSRRRIISPGIVTGPFRLLVVEIAVAILTLQATVINRPAGIDHPLWALRDTRRE